MNKRVRDKMLVFDIIIHSTSAISSLGDRKIADLPLKGYIKEELKVVTNILGKDTTSSIQIYFDGPDVIKIKQTDTITAGYYTTTKVNDVEVKKYTTLYANKPIIKKEVYYKPNRVVDLGVVYLP